MKYIFPLMALSILILLSGCENEESENIRTYPFIITLEPGISTGKALLSAEIIRSGSDDIVQYGFVWGEMKKPTRSNSSVIFNEAPDKSRIEYNLTGGIVEGKTYYVRAYAKTEANEIYGNVLSFISEGCEAPVITDYAPKSGIRGTRVKIRGKNFAQSIAGSKVFFGAYEAQIDSIGRDEIYAVVPWITTSEEVSIRVDASDSSCFSDSKFKLIFPWYNDTDFTTNSPTIMDFWFNLGDLLFCNQYNGNLLWSYNPASGEYISKSSMPFDVTTEVPVASFELNNKAYVLIFNSTDDAVRLWEYSLTTNAWVRKSDFPGQARTHMATNSLNGIGLVTAGYYESSGETTYVSETWTYDESEDTWTQRADFPVLAGIFPSGFTVDNTAYICTGILKKKSAVYKYNSQEDAWDYLTMYPGTSNAKLKPLYINNRVFVGFGRYATYSAVNIYKTEVWEYFPETNTWKVYIPLNVVSTGLYSYSTTNHAFILVKDLSGKDELFELIPETVNK